MPNVCDELEKQCAALYQGGVTIVRTVDGKFEQMSWKKVYHEMIRLADGYCVPYEWSFGIPDYVTLWRDKEGRVYAATGIASVPSDAPFKKDHFKPIYFEEVTPGQAKKLIDKIPSKDKRGIHIDLRNTCD